MNKVHDGIDKMIETVIHSIPKIIVGVIILGVGLIVIKLVLKLIQRRFEKGNVDESLRVFTFRIARFGLYTLLLLTVASTIGIPTTSFIAIFSAASLAVGLALQGSLSNFAGGILILFFRPFRVGDYISNNSNTSGTVERIDILYTTLRTSDGITVYSPNGNLANSVISNFTNINRRRLDFVLEISYDSNIKTAQEVILKTLDSYDQVLKTPKPNVFVNKLGDSGIEIKILAWTNPNVYWNTVYTIQEKVKTALDEANINIPFPQTEMRIISDTSK